MKYYSMYEDENQNIKFEIAGCPRNCAACKFIKPTDGLIFDKVQEQILLNLTEDFPDRNLIVFGEDPLFCGNRNTLTKLFKLLKEKNNTYILVKTRYNWDRIKHLEMFNYVDRVEASNVHTDILH